nr:MAG TPA: hypothetical protein [Caudoviricetes sp.]
MQSKKFQIYTISIDDHWSFQSKIPTSYRSFHLKMSSKYVIYNRLPRGIYDDLFNLSRRY